MKTGIQKIQTGFRLKDCRNDRQAEFKNRFYLNVILKDKNLIDFKMGCVVCLKRFEDRGDPYRDDKWAVEWRKTPELLR